MSRIPVGSHFFDCVVQLETGGFWILSKECPSFGNVQNGGRNGSVGFGFFLSSDAEEVCVDGILITGIKQQKTY